MTENEMRLRKIGNSYGFAIPRTIRDAVKPSKDDLWLATAEGSNTIKIERQQEKEKDIPPLPEKSQQKQVKEIKPAVPAAAPLNLERKRHRIRKLYLRLSRSTGEIVDRVNNVEKRLTLLSKRIRSNANSITIIADPVERACSRRASYISELGAIGETLEDIVDHLGSNDQRWSKQFQDWFTKVEFQTRKLLTEEINEFRDQQLRTSSYLHDVKKSLHLLSDSYQIHMKKFDFSKQLDLLFSSVEMNDRDDIGLTEAALIDDVCNRLRAYSEVASKP